MNFLCKNKNPITHVRWWPNLSLNCHQVFPWKTNKSFHYVRTRCIRSFFVLTLKCLVKLEEWNLPTFKNIQQQNRRRRKKNKYIHKYVKMAPASSSVWRINIWFIRCFAFYCEMSSRFDWNLKLDKSWALEIQFTSWVFKMLSWNM